MDECANRPTEAHPGSLYRQVRTALPASGDSSRGITCLRFSREIPRGDSSLIVIGTVNAAIVDNLAESESTWVWFRRIQDRDSVWVGQSATPGTSDVAPMTSESRC